MQTRVQGQADLSHMAGVPGVSWKVASEGTPKVSFKRWWSAIHHPAPAAAREGGSSCICSPQPGSDFEPVITTSQ